MTKKIVLLTGMAALLAMAAAGCGAASTPAKEEATTQAAAETQADENWYQAVLDEQAGTGEYAYYTLRDIDLDGVDELFLSTTEKYFIGADEKACVMACVDGQPKVLQEIGGNAGEYWLVNKIDATLSYFYRSSGEGHIVLSKLENGELVQIGTADTYGPHHYTEKDNDEQISFIDGEEVSQEEYDGYFEQYGNEAGALTYEAIAK